MTKKRVLLVTVGGNGGSAGVISSVANKFNSGRSIWLFDSFEGLPEPTESDITFTGELGKKGMDWT